MATTSSHEADDGTGDDSSSSSPEFGGIFAGDGERLNHGPMAPSRAFALLLRHDDASGVGSMIAFVNCASDQPRMCIAASHPDGRFSVAAIDRYDHYWTLEDPSFRNQRFASLGELVFYFSARNRRIFPLDKAQQHGEPSGDQLQRGAAIASRLDTGSRVSASGSAGYSDIEDDDQLPDLARTQEITPSHRARAMTVPASLIHGENERPPPPQHLQQPPARECDATDVGHIEYSFTPNNLPPRSHTVCTTNALQGEIRASQDRYVTQPTVNHAANTRPTHHGTESSIRNAAATIVSEDEAMRRVRRQDDSATGREAGCVRSCCVPICDKCSCVGAGSSLWRRCARSSVFCLSQRCCGCDGGAAGGSTDVDSPSGVGGGGGARTVKSVCRLAAECCCYVDRSEEPAYTMRRRGVLPMAGLLIGHLLWGLAYFFIMVVKVVLVGIGHLYDAIQQLEC